MPRFTTIEPDQASGKAKELLGAVQSKMGMVPNLMKTMANSTAVLQAYLGFGQALGESSLPASLREQIAVAVAGANGCEYCAAAHTALGDKFGVDQQELKRNLASESADPKILAALQFSRAIVQDRGWVGDADVQQVREAGYSDGEIIEIIATVAINTFTNYLNHIAQTEVDFPRVSLDEITTV